MRDLLMVAYVFPPLGGGGVHRTLGFARHLPPLGWRPTVVCASDRSRYWARDPSLTALVPPEAVVHRVDEGAAETLNRGVQMVLRGRARRAYERFALMPDRQITWFGPALAASQKIIEQRRPRALYSTGGPWTNHLLGLTLARRFDLPWVADFRDPWTQSELYAPASPLHRAAHRRLERAIYARAEAIIANTAYNLERLEADFNEARGKALCIPNGFDEETFAGVDDEAPSEGLTIAYAGSLYPGRDGGAFFAALDAVLARDPELARDLRVRLYGKVEEAAAALPPRVRERTEVRAYLPQAESNRALARASAVLMTMPETDGPVGFVPGKLYSLLRLGKPLLAPCGPGPAADLIHASDLDALVFDPRTEGSTEILARWLTDLRAGRWSTRRGGASNAPAYDRRTLTADLAAVLDRVAG